MIEIIKHILFSIVAGIIGGTLSHNNITSQKLSFWVIIILSVTLYFLGFIFGMLK
jgi:hypothetical protein